MTINQLIKKLEKIRDKHGKRIQVCADINQLGECHNPDFSHITIGDASVETITWAVGDNRYLENGEERLRKIVTLEGL